MKFKLESHLLMLTWVVVNLCIFQKTNAQTVGTGSVGMGTTAPHTSSILELSSTSKGLLLPRMTSAQRIAIASPATGLLVYQTNAPQGFYFYNAGWIPLGSLSANISLSNLGTTSINKSLIPSATATVDLGSGTSSWRDIYASGIITSGNLSTVVASNLPGDKPLFMGKKSRGTLPVPAPVATDDVLSSFAASGYDGTAFQNGASVDFIADNAPSAGNVPTRISFFTGSNKNNLAERMQIGSGGNIKFNNGQLSIDNATGNVGIGTTTPVTKLQVNGDGLFNNIQCGQGARAGNYYGYNGDAFYGESFQGNGVNGLSLWGAGVKGTSNRNVGVSGMSINLPGVAGRSNLGVGGDFFSDKSDGLHAGTANFTSFAGIFYGGISADVYQTSDQNLKQNIQEFGSAMSIINKLQPKTYEFKNDQKYATLHLSKGNHYGLMAQDVEALLPGLVKETAQQLNSGLTQIEVSKDGKPILSSPNQKVAKEMIQIKAINYTELIPILIKGMQEQQAQIDQQQKQIDNLTALLKAGK